MDIYKNQTFDEERALYGARNIQVLSCRFDGPADGESALKESCDVEVRDSYFNLRYPFWHDHNLRIQNCEMTDLCRAALWYSEGVRISDSRLHGIKALRELPDCCIYPFTVSSQPIQLITMFRRQNSHFSHLHNPGILKSAAL